MTERHDIITTPTLTGSTVRCSCGRVFNGNVWSPAKAARLGHAHLAAPSADLGTLLLFVGIESIGVPA